MQTTFTSKFYIDNRRKLQKTIGKDIPVILTANGLLQRGGDSTYALHQDSNFWYLTGIDEPDVILVISGGDEYLIVPGRSTSRAAFDGAVDDDSLRRISGIKDIYDEKEGWEKLGALLNQVKQVATPAAAPQYIEQFGLYPNPARSRLESMLKEKNEKMELVDIRKQLSLMRMVKQPVEIAAIQQAIDITVESLTVLTDPKRFAEYRHEYELEADLYREFRRRGAAGHAFDPIIAGGKRACTLHNVSNTAPLDQDSLVILDVGAEVSHYAADITRTRIYGKPSKRQKEIFDAVADVQAFALSLLKPGTVPREYEKKVVAYMGKKLVALKLIDSAGHEVVRKYFPHGTSHYLGLDVHDAGDYEKPLEPGVVLTCEPGIYIPEEGIGVRLEDDVLITAEGHEVMSGKLPKSLM